MLAGVMLVGCGGDGADEPDDGAAEPKGPITIGSKIDVEGPVLGYLMAGVLEDAGFDVVDRMRTGATDVVRQALLAGEIDAYPEYTANALTVFYADEQIDPAILQDADGDLRGGRAARSGEREHRLARSGTGQQHLGRRGPARVRRGQRHQDARGLGDVHQRWR
jgi:hypothetical protein